MAVLIERRFPLPAGARAVARGSSIRKRVSAFLDALVNASAPYYASADRLSQQLEESPPERRRELALAWFEREGRAL